jgi:hypothetical protein
LEIPPANVELLKAMTQRGIFIAICSKSDFAGLQDRGE